MDGTVFGVRFRRNFTVQLEDQVDEDLRIPYTWVVVEFLPVSDEPTLILSSYPRGIPYAFASDFLFAETKPK